MLKRAIQISFIALGTSTCCLTPLGNLQARELQKSVAQIQNQAEPGSGFFLKVGENTIFVTAKHVLGSSGEKVRISLPGGDILEIPLSQQVPIDGIDAAIIVVKSTPRDVIPLESSKTQLASKQSLIVWGYPVSAKGSSGILESRSGSYLGSPSLSQDGYTLLYGAQTQIGFSGGPILDEVGMVVGMHGRSESTQSTSGRSIRTGNALGIPINAILAAIAGPIQTDGKIDEKALAAQAGRASMKRVYSIMSNSSLSDQILEELKRAEEAGVPKHCIEIAKAYYYTFFSSLPDLSKASASQTILKKIDGVDPAYYALGSLIGRKSADFKKALVYDRILEQTGNSSFLQYSERRLVDEVKSTVERCSRP